MTRVKHSVNCKNQSSESVKLRRTLKAQRPKVAGCLVSVFVISLPFLHQQDDSQEDNDEQQDAGDGAGDLHRVVRLFLLLWFWFPGRSA